MTEKDFSLDKCVMEKNCRSMKTVRHKIEKRRGILVFAVGKLIDIDDFSAWKCFRIIPIIKFLIKVGLISLRYGTYNLIHLYI